MKDEKMHLQWIAYLLKRDSISKYLLFANLIVFAITGFAFRTEKMLYVSIGLLVFTVLYSFLSYALLGRYRINRENKFYDAVDFDCGWERAYKGREGKRVLTKWKGLKIESLTIHVDKASSVTTSRTKWKTIKMSVLDAFPIPSSGLITIFDRHSQGILTFHAYDPARETSQEKDLVFKESLYAFVYEMLGNSGQPLPILTISLGNAQDNPYIESINIRMSSSVEKYARKTFESNFNRAYENDNCLYTFVWGQNSLDINSVERGSAEERIIQGNKSLIELMSSSINGSFYASLGKEYTLTPEMITWGQENNSLERLTIDFTHTDISRPDRVENFEKLVNQGLHQLFKRRGWEFDWSISAFEKTLTITSDVETSDQSAGVGEISIIETPVKTEEPSIVVAVEEAPQMAPIIDAQPVVTTPAPNAPMGMPARPQRPSFPTRPTLLG